MSRGWERVVTDVHFVAVEWDEFADERVAESLRRAEAEIEALVAHLATPSGPTPMRPVLEPDLETC